MFVSPPFRSLFLSIALLLSMNASAGSPLAGISKISAGPRYTCALDAGGGVACWGPQVPASGGLVVSEWAKVMPGLESGISSIEAGNQHACVISTGGGLRCWGDNYRGQLGIGTLEYSGTPAEVIGLGSGVVSVAAGEDFTCALTTAGGVKCWGYNLNGQLGDGTKETRSAPVDVVGLSSGVVALAAGRRHACAVIQGGSLRCWGRNAWGALGDGSSLERLAPVDVVGLASNVASVAAGDDFTCALVAGGVKCWGLNHLGQLGDGMTSQHRLVPADVTGLGSGVDVIGTGYYTACAITMGALRCWGELGYESAVGYGGSVVRAIPAGVEGLSSGVAAFDGGENHGCGLMVDGSVRCVGLDGGRLGGGDARRPWAEPVPGLTGTVAVSAGGSHACAIASGALKCWGESANGQRGDPGTVPPFVVADVPWLASGVSAVSAGQSFTCVITTSGGVQCLGMNSSGQLGRGFTSTLEAVPASVVGLESGAASVSSGHYHACALTAAGGVQCWGSNGSGEVGDGSTTPRFSATAVSGLASGVAAVAVGAGYSCALTTAGGVKCWGLNGGGQLGDGTTVSRLVPVDVTGLSSGVSAISVGLNHNCALMASGAVRCWGGNSAGQLGDATTVDRLTPVEVLRLEGATAIAAGGQSTCAIDIRGAVRCWGGNAFGELGDGTTVNKPVPVEVAGIPQGAVRISAGPHFACAGMTDGAVKCWGEMRVGVLGTGGGAWRKFAAPVMEYRSLVSVAKLGTGNGSVTSNPAGIDCGPGCLAEFAPGSSVSLTANPDPGSEFVEWRGACSMGYGCSVDTNAAAGVGARFVSHGAALSLDKTAFDFGGQSLNAMSLPRYATITNTSGVPIELGDTRPMFRFASGRSCAIVPAGGTCAVMAQFVPGAVGPVSDRMHIFYRHGGEEYVLVIALSGHGEKSLSSHYYHWILGRVADVAGKTYWDGEVTRLQAAGANLNEAWYAMAGTFFGSAEYRARGRLPEEFITDLYRTFFNREADSAGLAYWKGQLDAGMSRESVLYSFLFSPEFRNFTQAIFGNTSVRPEIDVVTDLYRGILNRLPEAEALAYWVGRLRVAQCAGASAVHAEVETISRAFVFSLEYLNRSRDDTQFVTDLYYTMLRRGGDLSGVAYWVSQLASGARARDEVRAQFVASPEFAVRVDAMAAAGCVP